MTTYSHLSNAARRQLDELAKTLAAQVGAGPAPLPPHTYALTEGGPDFHETLAWRLEKIQCEGEDKSQLTWRRVHPNLVDEPLPGYAVVLASAGIAPGDAVTDAEHLLPSTGIYVLDQGVLVPGKLADAQTLARRAEVEAAERNIQHYLHTLYGELNNALATHPDAEQAARARWHLRRCSGERYELPLLVAAAACLGLHVNISAQRELVAV